MKKTACLALCALCLTTACASASAAGEAAVAPPVAEPAMAEAKVEYPSPPEIVAKAAANEWITIAPSDLMVMELTPDAKGKPRRVVIQLMPAPFSQSWVGNIRKLAAAKFWDGTSVNRVQDNYVVQWGDATEKKALPEGLAVVPESEYVVEDFVGRPFYSLGDSWRDPYAFDTGYYRGWPMAFGKEGHWPTHCYGMIGVGRNLSPDTGTGAELYTVIGHAPRHLDRNIALVGRVIEGIEHLSSLPRGTGPLGFYEKEEERVAIQSVYIVGDVKDWDKPFPTYEYLSTEGGTFSKYAYARANRRDPFFNVPSGGADVCNIPVPVRRKAQ
jgi:cyclophilin family peptidyl-prolyl cis-trans isomerase